METVRGICLKHIPTERTVWDHLKGNCSDFIPFVSDQHDQDSEDRLERIEEVKKWFFLHPTPQSIPQVESQISNFSGDTLL